MSCKFYGGIYWLTDRITECYVFGFSIIIICYDRRNDKSIYPTTI